MVDHHPLPFVSLFLWCSTLEICFIFCKHMTQESLLLPLCLHKMKHISHALHHQNTRTKGMGWWGITQCECWLDLWMKGNSLNIGSCGQMTTFRGECSCNQHTLPGPYTFSCWQAPLNHTTHPRSAGEVRHADSHNLNPSSSRPYCRILSPMLKNLVIGLKILVPELKIICSKNIHTFLFQRDYSLHQVG